MSLAFKVIFYTYSRRNDPLVFAGLRYVILNRLSVKRGFSNEEKANYDDTLDSKLLIK